MSNLSPARKLALEVGAAARERDAFAADILDAKLGSSGLSHEDRAFARVLCLGVASTWGTLDEIIDRCLRSPDDIRANVRDALRISTYEIIFLEKAGHAAVDQGVELVRAVEPRASRLANAVLRKVLAAGESFPFGDVNTDDAALARSCGFPFWLAQKLIASLGREGAAAFMRASNTQAPVYFAVNLAHTTDEQVVSKLRSDKVDFTAGSATDDAAIAGCLKAHDASAVASHAARKLFEEGSILVSDAAAQRIARLALPEHKPARFLEACAGRGTKTILLQSDAMRIYGSQMQLVTVDSHDFKGELLRKRAQAYGIEVAQIVCADATDLSATFNGPLFDAAFIDAPCSGIGTLRRHPEIRWRIAQQDIDDLSALDTAMLEEVARYVKVGGQLTYATCTVMAEENEYTVKRFLESEIGASYRIVPCAINAASRLFCKTTVAIDGCDAHFAAVLRRIK